MLDRQSVMWRYLGDVRFGLVLGRAFLLQLMHPTIAAGVAEHSAFRTDPWGRLTRSYGLLLRTVYGADGAWVGAQVRAAHRGITGIDAGGRRYHAWEPEAYWWVLATGLDSTFAFADRYGPPMTPAERLEVFQETRELGMRFGLRDRDMPHTLREFEDWYDEIIVERLEDSPVAGDLLALIACPPSPPRVPGPVWLPLRLFAGRALWLSTVGTLPRAARDILGIGWSVADRAQLEVLGEMAGVLRAVPRRWRYLPVARDGYGRDEGGAAGFEVAA